MQCTQCRFQRLCQARQSAPPTPIALAAAEVLCEPQQAAEQLYIVLSGALWVSAPPYTRPLDVVLPGEVLGLEALDLGHYHLRAHTLQPSYVCTFPLVELRRIAEQLPSLALYIVRLIGQEAAHHREFAQLQRLHPAQLQIVALLLHLQHRLVSESTIALDVLSLAQALDLSRTTVQRKLRLLQQNNLILLSKNGIKINDSNRLEQLLGRTEILSHVAMQ